jgi:hypothetical protein
LWKKKDHRLDKSGEHMGDRSDGIMGLSLQIVEHATISKNSEFRPRHRWGATPKLNFSKTAATKSLKMPSATHGWLRALK